MSTKTRSSRRFLITMGCLAISGLALLLWGQLKLVAGVPRTALAVPEAEGGPADQRPGPNAPR